MSTGFDYTITRTLDAPVADVWAAWTESARYGQWTGAEDVFMDVRPGGSWSSVMVIPGGARVPLTGTYPEVVPHERLVIGMNVPGGEPSLMTVTLTGHGETTDIAVSQTFATAKERDDAEQGSTFLLDGLSSHLAKA